MFTRPPETDTSPAAPCGWCYRWRHDQRIEEKAPEDCGKACDKLSGALSSYTDGEVTSSLAVWREYHAALCLPPSPSISVSHVGHFVISQDRIERSHFSFWDSRFYSLSPPSLSPHYISIRADLIQNGVRARERHIEPKYLISYHAVSNQA